MRRFFTYKTVLPTLLIVFLIAVPHTANAFSISGLVIQIFGYLLGAAGLALDEAIRLLVVQMGNQVMTGGDGNIGVGNAINTIWTIVRDLVNLTFIFGLIYVGIKTILDAGTDTKKMLASIIIGAVLVNFSLFISKVVIDVSNVTASQIYGQMVRGQISGPNSETRNVTISQAFMNHMGLIKLVALPDAKGEPKVMEKIPDDGLIHYVFGSTILMLFATFVFFAGAILLAIRFAVLIILMMLSPIAFAAAVFPSVAGWSKKWWSTLFSQAFFAPAYLFMLYIALTVAKSYGDASREFDTLSSLNNQNGITALIFFAVTIAMLIASLIIAKQMGAYGSSLATRTAGKLSFGVVAAVGRNTIGRAGYRLSEKDGLKEAASGSGVRGFMARRALDVTRFAGSSNFDIRSVADKTGTTKLTNLDYGKPQKGGQEQREKDIAKKEATFAKSLGKNEEAIKAAELLNKEEIEAAEDRLQMEQNKRIKDLEEPRALLASYLKDSVDESLTAAERSKAKTKAEAERLNIKSIEDAYRPVIKGIEDSKKALTAAQSQAVSAAKVSRQENYAKTLEKKVSFSPTFILQTWGENNSAAATIRKELKKSPQDEATEKIVDAVKGSSKKDD